MKHWLNNWEKYIGRRLSDAEAAPDSRVWTRIERELDAQLIDNRNRTLRRATGIILILLLLSSAFLFVGSPQAERAMAGDLIRLSERSLSGLYFYDNAAIEIFDAPSAIATLQPAKIVVAEMLEPAAGLQGDNSNFDEAYISEVTEERYILELAEIDMETDYLDVPLRSFANIPVRTYFQTSSPDTRAGGVVLNNQPITTGMREPSYEFRTGKRELLGRIASSTEVVSPLLVWDVPKELSVQSHVHSLVSGPASFEMIDPSFELGLSSTEIAMIDVEYAVELSDEHEVIVQEGLSNAIDEDLVEDIPEDLTAIAEQQVIAEVVEMEQKVSWMAGAMEELEEWKELMAEADATEKKELQELIEEAVIEEEDPLTRMQNEAMDLYRSYNVNKGFHIGLVAGFQNTWVTKETRNTEIDRSVVNTKMAPGYQAGINMGYDITDHFGIMMELKFSDEGGRYYNPVKDRTEHIDLKYFEVPVYAKVKHSKMTEKLRPIVFNYLIGFSYSDLRKVTTTIDGSIDQRFGQDYNTSQWGLSAGFDFDLYLHKNFFWTIGARAGISGDAKAFPKFKGEDGKSSMTIDSGIFTRLSFRLPGR